MAVTEGTLVLRLGRTEQRLRPGGVALVQGGMVLSCDDTRASYRFVEMTVVEGPAQPDARQAWGIDLPVILPGDEARRADQELRWCCDRWWRDDAGRLLAEARLGLLLATVIAARLADACGEDPFAAVEAEARARIPTGFDVADMAAACGLPRSTFCARYRTARGEPPGHFLRRERMDLACRLLTEGGWTIARLARHVGYASVPTFTRAFRAHHGRSPRCWGRDHGT